MLGAFLILFVLFILSLLFIYFGLDDKNPVALLLGIAIVGAILIIFKL